MVVCCIGATTLTGAIASAVYRMSCEVPISTAEKENHLRETEEIDNTSRIFVGCKINIKIKSDAAIYEITAPANPKL